jgi:hypothetical protein
MQVWVFSEVREAVTSIKGKVVPPPPPLTHHGRRQRLLAVAPVLRVDRIVGLAVGRFVLVWFRVC